MTSKFATPKLIYLLRAQSKSSMSQMFCSLPGKISSYNPSLTTAVIEVMMKKKNENTDKNYSYPALLDVPVLQLTGGLGGINLPIVPGVPCLVIFADRDIDSWYATGGSEIPNSDRIHSIGDGFALVGFRPQTNTVNRPDYEANSLYGDKTQISIKNNKVAMRNDVTDMKTLIDTIISSVSSAFASIAVTGPPGGPYVVTYTFTPPTPGDLLYQGDVTTPP